MCLSGRPRASRRQTNGQLPDLGQRSAWPNARKQGLVSCSPQDERPAAADDAELIRGLTKVSSPPADGLPALRTCECLDEVGLARPRDQAGATRESLGAQRAAQPEPSGSIAALANGQLLGAA